MSFFIPINIDKFSDPDPIEHATGREKKMLIARLAGDDRYEPKVYYRAEQSTREKPNLVPVHINERVIGCLCKSCIFY